MRHARPPLAMSLGIVLVAACLPGARQDLPASFTNQLEDRGWALELAPQPTADVITDADLVAQLGATDLTPMLRTRAVPAFGILSCTGAVNPCAPGPYAEVGDKPRPVWVVVYPDYVGATGAVGWVLVDAVGRLSGGYHVHYPRDPDR